MTLVELLVVIGIIAVLIGLLIPTLSGAMQSSRSVKCLSNLRQLAAAAQAYCGRNEESYPPAYWSAGLNSDSWDFSTTRDPATGRPMAIPGLLWRGDPLPQVQQCPSYDGKSNTPADPYTGYNYNTSFIGHGQYESTPAPRPFGQIRDPSRCALFGDGQYVSGANKYMRSPFPNPGDANFSARSAGAQGFRHRGRTNAVFCDGHAESLGERFTNTSDPNPPAPGTGFLSPDNSMYGG